MSDVDLTANDRRVIDLVRLALAKESVKKIIRREEFSEYIENFNDKELRKRAFELANEHLRKYFCMEIVPLPTIQPNFTLPAGARSKAQKIVTASSQPPNSFIVVSTLNPEERKLILQTAKNPQKLALLHIVLSLVWLNANRIEYMALHNQLVEFNIIGSSTDATVTAADLEVLLDEWREQRYISKAKRIDDQVTEYCWGPRAYVEFPVDRIADLIVSMAAATQTEPFDDKRLCQNATKAFKRQ